MGQSDRFEYQCQRAQLVEHLTKDSGGPGSNPTLIHHYFSHPIKNVLKCKQYFALVEKVTIKGLISKPLHSAKFFSIL